MNKLTKKHGGKREGSGLPALNGLGAGQSRVLTARLPDTLHAQIDALHAQLGTGTRTDAVRLALEAGLAKLTGGDKATAGNALELTQHLTQ